jgi:hypothetical protein
MMHLCRLLASDGCPNGQLSEAAFAASGALHGLLAPILFVSLSGIDESLNTRIPHLFSARSPQRRISVVRNPVATWTAAC